MVNEDVEVDCSEVIVLGKRKGIEAAGEGCQAVVSQDFEDESEARDGMA